MFSFFFSGSDAVNTAKTGPTLQRFLDVYYA